MPEPGYPLNCPYCRTLLAYERTEGETISTSARGAAFSSSRLTVAYGVAVRQCADGWVCEDHPGQPYPHTKDTGAECGGAGALCECPLGRAVAAYADAKYRSAEGIPKPH
jgi:hypothetical protein